MNQEFVQAADIGISIDTAVDIAKESADVIMLEKDLMVLEEGIVEGRKTYANMIKYIKMTVSSNFGNMFSVLTAWGLLSIDLSVSQGLGDTHWTHAYGLAENHAGLMDLCLKGAITWNLGSVSISGSVAYCDYVFDSTLRHSSRRYEASGQDDTSYHVVSGFALAVGF